MKFKTSRTLELEARLRVLRERMHEHIERSYEPDYDVDGNYLDLLGAIDTAARDVSWVAPCFMPSWRNRWYRKRRVENALRDLGLSRSKAKGIARYIP